MSSEDRKLLEQDLFLSNASLADILSDSEGHFAMLALRQAKSEITFLNTKLRLYEANTSRIIERTLSEGLRARLELEDRVARIRDMTRPLLQDYEAKRHEAARLYRKLVLFEEGAGLENIVDEELGELEKKLLTLIDRVKTEKAKRMFEAEIDRLKMKLGVFEGGGRLREERVFGSQGPLETEWKYDSGAVEEIERELEEIVLVGSERGDVVEAQLLLLLLDTVVSRPATPG